MENSLTNETSNKIANMGFVCALFVVFIHLFNVPTCVGSSAWKVWYILRMVCATIGVPYFFVVSGYFLSRHCDERGWYQRAVKSRMSSLVVPFLLWNVATLFYGRVLYPLLCELIKGKSLWQPLTVKGLMTSFGLNPFVGPADGPLWYVRALCMFVLISPIIVKGVRKMGFWLLPLLFGFYVLVNPGHVDVDGFWVSEKWRSFWRFGLSVEGLFYFTLGVCLSFNRVVVKRKTALCLGGVGMLLGIVRMCLKANGCCDCGYLVPFTIPFVMLGVWTIMPKSRWPKLLVGNSFAIYVSHMLILSIFGLVVKNLPFALDKETGVLMFIELAATVGIAMIIACALKNFMPRLVQIAYGGR